MNSLDISLTKDSSLLLYAIHSLRRLSFMPRNIG